MKSHSAVDVGMKRKINQDSIYSTESKIGTLPNLFIVADGMGGHNAGDFASRYAVSSVTEYIRMSEETDPEVLFLEAIKEANAGIKAESSEHEELSGMGSTIVVASVINGVLCVANVGDSRLYVLEDGLRQVTRDHSLVAEMVRLGEITEEEARNHPDKNIITRALGASLKVEPDFFCFELEDNAQILMCSDGLSNMVEDAEIEKVLLEDLSAKEKTQKLINTANENGGKDNIAVIVVEPFK